ncbi:MAG: hypothetical protein ACREKN_01750 [Longimicrobiaceae bacterium]
MTLAGLLYAALAAPLAAQEPLPTLPGGWQMRLDRPDAPVAEVRITQEESGYRVSLGPSGIFYHPGVSAQGLYRLSSTFTQRAPGHHPEGYGLFVGGRELEGPDQDYLYFLIRQDGRFLIKHRAGNETHTLREWTAHDAIRRPGPDSPAVNQLAVESRSGSVVFLVNGAEVTALPRLSELNTDGVSGFRVNHRLQLEFTDLSVDRLEGDAR